MDPGRYHWLRSIARVLMVWVSEAIGLVVMTHIVPGLRVDTWGTAILVVAVIALLNAILWPILSRITLPFLVFTFGVGALILNGLLVWLTSRLVHGFHRQAQGVRTGFGKRPGRRDTALEGNTRGPEGKQRNDRHPDRSCREPGGSGHRQAGLDPL